MSITRTLTHNRTNRVIIKKNAIIVNIIHNILNLPDSEIAICIILVLVQRADGDIKLKKNNITHDIKKHNHNFTNINTGT